MKDKFLMPISEFSRLTGIKRENLRYYDQIGLLSPECRGANDYRYYTRRQLSTANLILSLRELGISIDEIKKYADKRTPDLMFSLFKTHEQRILDEIKKLDQMRKVMHLYVEMARDALQYEESSMKLEYKQKEPIYVGPVLTVNGSDEEDVISFYNYANENGMDTSYPLGAIIHRDGFQAGGPLTVKQYYFRVTDKSNAYKPEGQYAIAYGKCAYGESDPIYWRLLAYIKENNMEICSDVYEEYPLNELSTQIEEEYCVKIEVMVKESI